MRRWITALVLVLGSSALGGCGDKTYASLSVFFADPPSVSAVNGSALDGGFQISFIPGPDVSTSTTVTLGDFSLQRGDGTTLVDPLQVDATDATFPITITPGNSKVVTFTITSAPLTQAQHDAICASQVVIVGSVMDSPKGRTDSFKSVAITPTCR